MLATLMLYLRPILRSAMIFLAGKMEVYMFRWIKSMVLKWAMKQVKAKIESLEKKEPKLKAFRYKFYYASIPEFVKWGTTELVQDASIPDEWSIVDYIKKLIEPLADPMEELVDQAIDELAPGEKDGGVQ